jgi:hypothetical protein
LDPADFPAVDRPATRPPADEQSLAPGTGLASVDAHFHADRAHEYLVQIGETLPLYTDAGIAHPGWLLLAANTVLSGSVLLGPWIHVSSDACFHREVIDGQSVSTRGRVRDRWERKGHHFVALDVLVLADGKPAMSVDHTAIYKVRDPQ